MIELRGLHKAFAGRPAVTDLSLSVPVGSIHGLLGHNGAGKSTTLGMLLGQVFPDAGTVTIDGHDVFADRASALSRVGAIFEAPCFYDYLTGRRNLAMLAAFSRRVTPAEIDAVAERSGLGDRVNDPVRTYSHGMRQRLALAQALLPTPRLLLLDEPTDGLDPEGIAAFRATLLRLREELDLTILFSSHLLSEVELLCDRVAVLKGGRLRFAGDWRAAAAEEDALTLEVDRPADARRALEAAGLIRPGDAGDRWRATGEHAAINACLVHAGFAVSTLAPRPRTLEDFYLDAEPPTGGAPC